jgi:serine protease Do
VARDPQTDLAIIHIPVGEPLPLIRIGTSSDLMEGERVVAIGNAYGYPHTVTCGFISALHRSVQVNDAQKYYDLIQTNADINPGNSGGPLLNIDGQMIGINVAVRVGAQGIAFAIPVDRAMEVAAKLMGADRLGRVWHGIEGETTADQEYVIKSVQKGSPAEVCGVKSGDVLLGAQDVEVCRQLDLERALIDCKAGDQVTLKIQRNRQPMELQLALASTPTNGPMPSSTDQYWTTLGMRLQPVTDSQMRKLGAPYHGGLRVVALRTDSPAAQQGIREGDVLVGMHKWETISLENVNYILSRPDLRRTGKVKFYVVRGAETLYGHLPLYR